jgi:hypothetical protein
MKKKRTLITIVVLMTLALLMYLPALAAKPAPKDPNPNKPQGHTQGQPPLVPHDGSCVSWCARAPSPVGDLNGNGHVENCLMETKCHHGDVVLDNGFPLDMCDNPEGALCSLMPGCVATHGRVPDPNHPHP